MARISILLIAVALIAGMVSYAARPIEIQDWYDLNAIRDNLGGSYLLMNDLDSTTPGYNELASPTANGGRGWEPIGSVFILIHVPTTFQGTFDGQGYEIHDLFINWPDEEGVGLFAVVGGGGHIENIGVVNATVTGGGLVGLFALVEKGGRIEDIGMVNATVTGKTLVGGLVGRNLYGTVSNSYSSGDVTGNYAVGGLVGVNDMGIVSNSYSTGNVTGNSSVGGLVGNNGGTVSNCYSTSSVSGSWPVGGLVGLDLAALSSSYAGTVSDSFWDTQTSGQATSVGGTGKTTAEMQNIATFSGAAWNITAVATGETNPTCIWNIVDDVTYPFLSWQS